MTDQPPQGPQWGPPPGQQPPSGPPGGQYPPQGGPPAQPPKKRKKWPFILGGIILLIIVIAIASSSGGSKSTTAATTTTGTQTPTTSSKAPVPTTTVQSSRPSTTTVDAPPVANSSPADVAKQVHASCLQFESSVVPVIRSNVSADDLAPIIRLHMGILPDSTTGANDPNAPYLQVSTEFGSEASDDPGFQPIYDAMNGLTNAIIRADPSGDLHEIDSAVNTVTHQCEALHALP